MLSRSFWDRSFWDRRLAIAKGLHEIGLGEKQQRLPAKRTTCVALREALGDWANDRASGERD